MVMIKSFLKMLHTEVKMNLREPLAAMMAFIMPIFLLLLLMEEVMPMKPHIDHIVPSLIVLVVTMNAIFILPVFITTYREIKYFTRLKATPMTPLTLLSSLGIANFVMTMLGILTLLIVGMFLYDAEFGGQILTFSAGFILVVLCVTSMGILIASLCRTTKTAEGVGGLFALVLMFFSDLFIPLKDQPEWVGAYLAPLLPTSYAVELIRGLWLGEPLYDFSTQIIILLGFTVLLSVLSVWRFRWE